MSLKEKRCRSVHQCRGGQVGERVKMHRLNIKGAVQQMRQEEEVEAYQIERTSGVCGTLNGSVFKEHHRWREERPFLEPETVQLVRERRRASGACRSKKETS